MRNLKLRLRVFWTGIVSIFLGPPLVKNPVFRFPRNQECFCNSRRKFKKCHEPRMPQLVTRREAKRLKKSMNAVVKELGHDPFLKAE